MGLSIGLLLDVIWAVLGFSIVVLLEFAQGDLPDSNRSIARLNCPWIQEPHERPITVANTAPVPKAGGTAVCEFPRSWRVVPRPMVYPI